MGKVRELLPVIAICVAIHWLYIGCGGGGGGGGSSPPARAETDMEERVGSLEEQVDELAIRVLGLEVDVVGDLAKADDRLSARIEDLRQMLSLHEVLGH